MRTVIIGTRGSSLSLCQTEQIQVRLQERFPQRRFTIKTIKAQADRNPEVPLVTLGGEGVFVKELETALLRRDIDVAVHSLKDLPLAIPDGLTMVAITEREDPSDALISRSTQTFEELPAGSRIGTSSLRRKSQLLCRRKDLQFLDIRGNVDTRLRKLDEGQYDAIVLAACGLIRLGLEERISDYLPFEWMLPEPGQGALGIQARAKDEDVLQLVEFLNDATTRACVEAERAFLRGLGGGCHLPIAALGRIEQDQLILDGAVIAPDGSTIIREQLKGSRSSPESLGESLASQALAKGAKTLLSGSGRV